MGSQFHHEPINSFGDGNTEPDWQITGELALRLRAERAGGGIGRVYTVHIACTDASGNTATAAVQVTVPHDRGKQWPYALLSAGIDESGWLTFKPKKLSKICNNSLENQSLLC